MRLIPIRRLLAISLVLLATVPALLVAWVLGRAAGDSVDALAGDLLGRVAALVQAGTEGELRRAHDVLNGVFPERLNPAQAERAIEIDEGDAVQRLRKHPAAVGRGRDQAGALQQRQIVVGRSRGDAEPLA